MLERINKVFKLWVDITGIDPTSNKIRLKDFDIYSANKEIEEALNLDETGVTALLLMDYFTEEYLENKTISVMSLIEDFENANDYIAKCKELISILNSPDLVYIRENYKNSLFAIINKMGISRDSVVNMINDKHAIAFLVRDALKSFNNLYKYQFTFGKTNSTSMKYVESVYAFWNVNSMVRVLNSSMDYGVALTMIKDPEEMFSYFGFAIKNGENLLFLTDKPQFAHPLQKFMTRRPDRYLSDRAYKNHFPYDLLSIDISNGAKINKGEVIPYNTNALSIRDIKDLSADEMIWTILMFALIEKNYFIENNFENQQVYLGDMVHYENTNLPTIANCPILTIKPITSEDVKSDNMVDVWEHKSPQINKWLEERYDIDESCLNLMGHEALALPATGITVPPRSNKLQVFDPTNFGTEEEITNYRKWLARYNKALLINDKIQEEYKRDEEEIKTWFKKAVHKNADKLLEYVVKSECIETFTTYETFSTKPEIVSKNILTLHEKDQSFFYPMVRLRQYIDRKDKCFFNGGPVGIVADFYPHSPEGLKLLTGCDDIPEILEHWTKHLPYTGNCILNNIDPMDWKVNNPWLDVSFNIRMYISRTAYNKKRKELGLEPLSVKDLFKEKEN